MLNDRGRLYVGDNFIDHICNIRLSRFCHGSVALVFVINKPQSGPVEGVVIPEYQPAVLVLVMISVTDLFSLIFCVNVFSNLQNRSINQDDSRFAYSLFGWPNLYFDIDGFRKSKILDLRYGAVKGIQIITKGHARCSLVHSDAHPVVLSDYIHLPIPHIQDLFLLNLLRSTPR